MKRGAMPKRIIYHPPSRQAVEQYVRTLCERLAQRDTSYLTPEITSGLSRFLQIATVIVAKHLTQESEEEDESLASDEK